jgi:PAS domain S-box-containing protein
MFGVVGFDGYLRAVNPAWTRILGHDTHSLLAHPFLALIDPRDRPAASAAIAGLKRGNVVAPFESRMPCDHGGWRWIAWTAVAEDELVYTVGRDVTHEKLAAHEL